MNLQALIAFDKLYVGKTGFEPATPWSQTRCATGLRYFPNIFFTRCPASSGATSRSICFIASRIWTANIKASALFIAYFLRRNLNSEKDPKAAY